MAYRKQKQTPEDYFKLHQQRKQSARAYYNAGTKVKVVKSMTGGRSR